MPGEVTDDWTIISEDVRRELEGGKTFINFTVSVVIVVALVQGQAADRAAARVSSVLWRSLLSSISSKV